MFISGRGRLVLFKLGDYRKVELSQPGPLLEISYMYFVQSSELDELVFHSYFNGEHVS